MGTGPAPLPVLPRLGGPRPAPRRARHQPRIGPPRPAGAPVVRRRHLLRPHPGADRRAEAAELDARGITRRRRRGRPARRRRRPADRRRAGRRPRRRPRPRCSSGPITRRTPTACSPGSAATSTTAGFAVVDGTGRTTRPGVWAAGNVVDPRAQVITAAGAGSAAAIAINADLVQDDIARAVEAGD